MPESTGSTVTVPGPGTIDENPGRLSGNTSVMVNVGVHVIGVGLGVGVGAPAH